MPARYKANMPTILPDPVSLAAQSWADDQADTDFSALTPTARAKAVAGKMTTGSLTVGDGGVLTLGFHLDDIYHQRGGGLFDTNNPLTGLVKKPMALGLSLAKVAGAVGGGTESAFTTGAIAEDTAGANAVAATIAGTFSDQPINGETVTLNGQAYTFLMIASATPFGIQIGESADETRTNLVEAITLTGVAGTDYGTGTTEHPTMTASPGSSGVINITAKTAGAAGNALTLAEDSIAFSFAGGATTLAGGADAIAREIIGDEAFEVSTVASDGSDDLNDLDQATLPLNNGLDSFNVAGKTPGNNDWSGAIIYTTGMTLQQLAAAIATLINAEEDGTVTASIDGSGQIVLTDDTPGASSTSVTTFELVDISGGSFVSAVKLDHVTASGPTLSRETVASMSDGPWLIGAASATPTEFHWGFASVEVDQGSLELVIELTCQAGDTVNFEIHAIPGAHYIIFDEDEG